MPDRKKTNAGTAREKGKAMAGKWAAGILGGALLVVLVVTMVRISGPAAGSSGRSGEKAREESLSREAARILSSGRTDGSVFEGAGIRFGGQVLRVRVGSAWERLSEKERGRLLDEVFVEYAHAWQTTMKSSDLPAVSFREKGRRVALRTSVDRWVRSGGGTLAPGASK